MREAQLEMREYSAHNAFLITKVLKSSSSAVDREAAAELLGYADQSERQIKALAAACFDSGSEVRNNAMRALAVLAFSNPSKATNIATKTPLVRFMEMFNSPDWTDRNKALALFSSLTASRDPHLLTQLRTRALSSLLEMAQWKNPDDRATRPTSSVLSRRREALDHSHRKATIGSIRVARRAGM